MQDAGHDGGGDVVDEDEVPHDLAVLVDRDGLALLGQASEEGDDAGVGVDEGLAGSVDVLKPEEHRGNVEGAAPGRHEVLLAELGGGVDIGRGGLDLGGGLDRGGQAGEVPLTGLEHRVSALPGVGGVSRNIDPLPLAVDGPGGGQDDLVGTDLVAHEGVEHLGGADDVDVGVPGGLGEGLASPGLRRQVDDGIRRDLGQERVPVLGDGHVQAAQLHALVELGRASLGGVDLRVHVVQGHDTVEGVRQVMRDRAADESGTTGHEAGTGHEGLPWCSRVGAVGRALTRRTTASSLFSAFPEPCGPAAAVAFDTPQRRWTRARPCPEPHAEHISVRPRRPRDASSCL